MLSVCPRGRLYLLWLAQCLCTHANLLVIYSFCYLNLSCVPRFACTQCYWGESRLFFLLVFFKTSTPTKLFYSQWFLRKCWGIRLNWKTHLDTSESDLNSVLNGLTFYQKLSRHLKLRASLFAPTISSVLVDVIKGYTWTQMIMLYSPLCTSFVVFDRTVSGKWK